MQPEKRPHGCNMGFHKALSSVPTDSATLIEMLKSSSKRQIPSFLVLQSKCTSGYVSEFRIHSTLRIDVGLPTP